MSAQTSTTDLVDADAVGRPSQRGPSRPDLPCGRARWLPDAVGCAGSFAVNVLGTINLLGACLGGASGFVHTGSSSEYGFKRHAPRDDYLEPNSDYAVTKAAATLYCRHIAVDRGINVHDSSAVFRVRAVGRADASDSKSDHQGSCWRDPRSRLAERHPRLCLRRRRGQCVSCSGVCRTVRSTTSARACRRPYRTLSRSPAANGDRS